MKLALVARIAVVATRTPAGGGFILANEGAEYRIERRGGVPAGNETKPIAAAGIVGTWRHPQGYAKFNADGTGEVDGNPGRYEIQGNQIAMSGAAGRVTMTFTIEGDRLTFTGNGQSVVLNSHGTGWEVVLDEPDVLRITAGPDSRTGA